MRKPAYKAKVREMINFAIGIPTLNRADLLNVALQIYSVDFPNTKIYVLDNGNQDIRRRSLNIEIIKSRTNMGVAPSWNVLCKKIFENHEYAVILNDDIIWGQNEQTIKTFLADAEKTRQRFIRAFNDWCAFAIHKKTFEQVGAFDEQFKIAYYEDTDYERRMKLAGIVANTAAALTPTVYRNSQTIEKEPSLHQAYFENKERYIAKWGGDKGQETFKTPYNQ